MAEDSTDNPDDYSDDMPNASTMLCKLVVVFLFRMAMIKTMMIMMIMMMTTILGCGN